MTRLSSLAVVVLLVVLSGCTGSGPHTVPVYGQIRFEGREKPKVCRLFFQPLDSSGPSRPSIAEVAPDGTYEVTAYKQSDGLLPGTYRVRVSYFDLKPGANPGLDASWIQQSHEPEELIVDASSSEIEFDIVVPRKS